MSSSSLPPVAENGTTQLEELRRTLLSSHCGKRSGGGDVEGYECMICMSIVRRYSAVWSCGACWAIFHLNCLHDWAKRCNAAAAAAKTCCAKKDFYRWRCPACQKECESKDGLPKYLCFCGHEQLTTKGRHIIKDGPLIGRSPPHSCGGKCVRKRETCSHVNTCRETCHPGPCPPCDAVVDVFCLCGAEKRSGLCSDLAKASVAFSCNRVCNQRLNCGKHLCEKACHKPGECSPCWQTKKDVACFCGNTKADQVACPAERFSCNRVCGKPLPCGNHLCVWLCHSGDCHPCASAVTRVSRCSCGKKQLKGCRQSCADPIQTCGQICGKIRSCGHSCQLICHEQLVCPPCKIQVKEECVCGKTTRSIECGNRGAKDAFRCTKVCKMLKSCQKHRCQKICCTVDDSDFMMLHMCMIRCGKPSSCGVATHTCPELCHLGRCPPCPSVIREHLFCACGKTQLAPPQPCGTPTPECKRPCSLLRTSCAHLCSTGNCHQGSCPPCPANVIRQCLSHGASVNVRCYFTPEMVSCGKPCGKLLSCGRHHCSRLCHNTDACQQTLCDLPCGKQRISCPHTCQATCSSHTADGCCPDVTCQQLICNKCACGTVSRMQQCGISDSTISTVKSPPTPCDAVCDENRRRKEIALAFGKRNNDTTAEFYDDNFLDWGHLFTRQNVCDIETTLEEAVLCPSNKSPSPPCTFMAACPLNKCEFVKHYAEFFYGLKVKICRDPCDKHPHCEVEQDLPFTRVPNPRLSEVLGRTPSSFKNLDKPLIGFKRNNVIRFGSLTPVITFRGVDPIIFTARSLSRLIDSFRGEFRIATCELKGTKLVAEFINASIASKAWKVAKQSSSLHCVTSSELFAPQFEDTKPKTLSQQQADENDDAWSD